MIVVLEREADAEGQLQCEAQGKPSGPEPRCQKGHGRGDGEQVAGGPREEDDDGAGEKESDPRQQKPRIAIAPIAPRQNCSAGEEDGTDNEAEVDRQRQRATELMWKRLESVAAEVAGQDTRR